MLELNQRLPVYKTGALTPELMDYMAGMTGVDPAWSCLTSKCNCRIATHLYITIYVVVLYQPQRHFQRLKPLLIQDSGSFATSIEVLCFFIAQCLAQKDLCLGDPTGDFL